MTDGAGRQDVPAIVSGVSLAITDSPDVHEMLTVVARRTAEALDVSECDVYEYRAETEDLVGVALWARELDDADRAWLGTVFPLAERPSFRRLVEERALREYRRDDPSLVVEDRTVMERWGEHSVVSLPLVFQDKVIGALSLVEKRGPRTFTADEMRLLELLAVPAAVAVQNARLLRREADQNRRLEALLTATRAMATATGLDELLDSIARTAREALDADECAIDTYDPDDDSITVRAFQSRAPKPDDVRHVGKSFSLAEYPADRTILLNGEIVEERASDPDLDDSNRRSMIENGEASCLSVPLVYEARPIGLLAFFQLEEERHFTEQERELAEALGEHASAAIHHAELVEQTERHNRHLKAIIDATRAVSNSVDLDEVLAIVARTTADALGAEQCQIQEFNAAANTVTPIVFWQRHDERPAPDSLHRTYSLDAEPDERALLESRKVTQQLYSDPELSPITKASMEKYGDLSYLNLPLVSGDQSFGAMVLVETDYERRWTEEDVTLGRALGEQAAVAIEQARLYKIIRDQAITDGLTGLYNHRYFYERLEQEVARARRYGTPVSLLMMDLDDFKAYNDRHGHLAGDAVLREVATVLREELRARLDIAARYGGEEFAVILPNTPMNLDAVMQMHIDQAGESSTAGLWPDADADAPPPGHRGGAEEVAERIRRRVAESGFVVPGIRAASLTVSVGVAVFPYKTASAEELVGNADAALYKAKRAGKDRVETYG
jgi:diguanylate cyclase (GGDEF)-like protein